MSTISLIVLSIGLAMDAFAVAICKGLAMQRWSTKKALTVGIYFGIFQGLMPVIGYFLGAQFSGKISAIDHWIAFALLVLIGGKMVKESFSHDEDCASDATDFKTMSVMAIATSIDALAMGISFAFLKVNIVEAALFIGVITFALSVVGVKIGNVFGSKFKSKAEFCGGLILIILGAKILIEHML